MNRLGESSQPNLDLAAVTVEDFKPLKNQTFRVDLRYFGLASDASPLRADVYPPDTSLELELVKVTARKPYSDQARTPFTLLFRGSHDLPLYSQVHVLEHEAIGRMAVLISPVIVSAGTLAERHSEGRFYECQFS